MRASVRRKHHIEANPPRKAEIHEKLIDGMKCYTAEDLTAALKAAGFGEVSCGRHPEKPWLTVLAKK